MRECQAITPMRFRGVNCYLVKTGEGGYVLIDTGFSSQRTAIKQALVSAGCTPGTLHLIVLTHGDADHVGNAAALRATYGAPIALHRDEVEAVTSGNPARNKQLRRNLTGLLVRLLLRCFQLKPSDRFTPDVALEEGDDLRAYGFDAQILHLPGHPNGSIGVLTASGNLFCGDLLRNGRKPAPGLGTFDQAGFQASLEKLKRLPITTVYPRHGQPFPLAAFLRTGANRRGGDDTDKPTLWSLCRRLGGADSIAI